MEPSSSNLSSHAELAFQPLNPLIRLRTLASYISAIALGLFAGLAGYAFWRAGILPEIVSILPASPTGLITPEPLFAAAGLGTYSLALSLTVTRFGLRRSWQYILVSFVFVASVGIAGAQFFGLDLLLLPLIFSGVIALLLVQINRLWFIDRQLARTLLNSPVNNGDSSVGANARLLSGLKLLNTVLPLAIRSACSHWYNLSYC